MSRLRWVLALSAIVIAVGFASMPNHFYRGDPRAVRFGTAQLLERGSYGVPYAEHERVPAFLVRFKGQMLFQNDESEILYSKYRLLNSLAVIPPMAVEKLQRGSLELHHATRSLLFLLNAYNVLIAVVIALYMFALGRRYTRRPWLAALVTVAGLYGTYVWFYLRAQASEIFQMWFLLGFVTHLVVWNDRDPAGRHITPGFGAAMLYGVLLTQLKPYYGLLFPLAWLALVASQEGSRRLRVAATGALSFGAFAAVAAIWVVVENALVFGGPLNFGYSQAEYTGSRVDYFDPAILLESVPGFLFRMDRSVLTHMPLLLLVPFSVPQLLREHRFDLILAALLFPSFMGLIGSYSYWPGDWCYGPRYLVFLVPFVGMLSLPALDRLAGALPRDPRAWLAVALIAATLAGSAWLQTRVNALEFHANYEARSRYRGFENETIDRYFTSHSGVVFSDLLDLRDGRGVYPPSEWARQADPGAASRVAQIERDLSKHFVLRTNYFWSAGAGSEGAP